MKVKTSELSGRALGWAVASCFGHECDEDNNPIWFDEDGYMEDYEPWRDWAQGGPLIEREGICISKRYAPVFLPEGAAPVIECVAQYFIPPHSALEVHRSYGPTPLVAAMRCFLAAQVGDTIEVPDALVTESTTHVSTKEQ